jgi:hypothetical protein
MKRTPTLLALILSLTACGGDGDGDDGAAGTVTTTPTPTRPTPTTTMMLVAAETAEPTSIDAGVYRIPRSGWSVADLTVTMPAGWTVQYGHAFHKHPDEPDEIAFYPVILDAIYADACQGNLGDLVPVGGDNDLATALLEQTGAVTSGPVETTLGGYPASRIDLTFPVGSDLSACSLGGDGLQVWHSSSADKYFVLARDGIASVYIVDVAGQQQVFVTQHRSSTSTEDLRELATVLESVSIEP